MSIFKRLVSAALAVVLLAGMIPPLPAHAEEIETLPDVTEAIVTKPQETTAPAAETTIPTEEVTLPAETAFASEPAANTAVEETQVLPEPTDPTEATWEAVVLDDGILASGSCGENLTWVLDDSGVLTISGIGAMADYQSGYTPWESYRNQITSLVIEEGVTQIGTYAFAYLQSMTEVSFPESLTAIGDNAFQSCFELTDLTLPEGLVSIGKEAFCYSNSLRISQLPAAVVSIGASAFKGTGLTGIVLSAGLTTIPDSAFRDCRNLERVTISADDTVIGSNAFSTCSALKTVSVSGSIASIGTSAFASCWSMTDIALPEGLTEIGSRAFFNCSDLALSALPDSVQIIASEAFSGCHGLTLSALPASLVQLGEGAFEYCSGITVSAIPAAITQIPKDAFSGCESITAFALPEGVTAIGDNAFSGAGLAEITIPASVTSIGDTVFGYNSSLSAIHVAQGNSSYASEGGVLFNADKTLLIQYPAKKADTAYTIPETVTTLGPLAFYLCENITSIEIPGTIAAIGEETFYNCRNLSAIVLNEGIETIENGAFNYSGLTSIRIPASVSSIADVVFEGCSALYAIEVSESNAAYASHDGVLMDKAKTTILAFPDKKDSFVIPETVTELEYGCFYNAEALTSIQIPGSIETIPGSAFSYCSKLTSVTLGEGIKVINTQAFSDCSALTSITFPASIETIANNAFAGCKNLREIRFMGDAPTIADTAFGASWYPSTQNPTAVVTYPADNATWTEDKFQNYGGSLTWVMEGAEVPVATGQCGRELYWTLSESGVLSITGTGAMKNYNRKDEVSWYAYRNDITEVIIAEGATNVGRNAFNELKALTKATLPETVTEIGNYAFYYCESLTEITLPAALTSIGESAFYQCRKLEAVSMGQNVSYIGANAFYGTPWYNQQSAAQDFVILSGVLTKYNGDSTVVEIPESVTAIGERAFYDCAQLETVIIPEGIHTIGSHAFDQCSNLHTVVLPSTLTAIGDYAFRSCALTSVTFPEGLQSIGSYAFLACTGLSEILLPDSVTSLGQSAFQLCTGLKKVHIGSGLRALEISLFEGCTGLTAIEIPYTITLIDSHAFSGCKNLADVTFQEGISTLGGGWDDWEDPWYEEEDEVVVYPDPGTALEIQWGAFGDCDALTEVYLPGHLSNLASTAFRGCDNTTHFYVSSPNYLSDDSGSIYGHSNGTLEILVCVPAKLSGKFVIPDSVTTVYADFYGCSLLTSVTFSAGVGGICDNDAFFGCTSLTEIIAGEGNDGGYYNDASGALLRNSYGSVYLCGLPADLTEYTVPADVTRIYTGSISNAPLTAIHVEAGNQVYSSQDGVLFTDNGNTLVKYPSARTDVRYVIPFEVEQLDEYAFLRLKNLKELWFVGEYFYPNTDAFDSNNSTLTGYFPQNRWDEHFIYEMGFITDGTLQWKPYTLLTAGDSTINSLEVDMPLAVRTTQDISGLKSVQVDGKTLAASNYFTSENGNFVCFLPAYLGTLASTAHTFRFQFADSYEEISTCDEASAAMAEFEEMLARAAETGEPVILNSTVTLTKDLSLSEYYLVRIREGGHLIVPSGVTLTLNGRLEVSYGGKLDVEAGGTLVNQGQLSLLHPGEGSCIHVSGTYRSENGMAVVYADSMRIPEITGIPKAYQQLFVRNTDEAALLWALEQQAQGYGEIEIIIQNQDIILEEDITIEKNTYLSVNPNYSTQTNTTLTLNGNTTLAGTLIIETYEEYGICGIVQNNGVLTVAHGGNLYNYGQLLGNEPVVPAISQADFEAQLAEAAESGTVRLTTPLILERDLTVNCRLFVDNGGQLTIPSGVTLTVDRYLDIQNGGKVDVQAGGTLVNNDILYVRDYNSSGSYLHVNGTYVHGEASYLGLDCSENFVPEITGIAPGFQTLNFSGEDEAVLLYAASLQDQGYSRISVSLWELVLNSDVTIGQNMDLHVYANDTGTLPNMTNNGNLTLKGTLVVERNSGDSSRHYVQNNGSLSITPSGKLSGWTQGNDPIYLGPSQEDLEQMLDTQGPAVVYLESTLTLERDLTIPEGVGLQLSRASSRGSGHLIVPEGCTLTVNGALSVDGKLDVEAGGTLVNNGELSTPEYSEDNRYIHINGSYVHGDGASVSMFTYCDGMPDVTGIESKYIDLSLSDARLTHDDESFLLQAIALEDTYHSITVSVNSLILNSDVTIGENTKLLVNPTFEEDDVNLTINGSLTLNGYMSVFGSDPPNVAVVRNNGSLTINETGELLIEGYFRGNQPVNNGGFLYSNLGGPVPNFRDFELRPETTTVDTSKTDAVLLTVHTSPLLHAPEDPTFPDWTWTSSNHSIVDPSDIINNLDDTFTVPIKENAMGTVTLTASFKYMPGVTASTTLTVFHLDPAKKLTASADLPAIGLQPGQQAAMLVFGSDPEKALDADSLVFTSANGEIASVDEHGMITAGSKTGTVKITAAIPNDPLKRKVTLSVKVISPQTQALTLADESGSLITGMELDLADLNGEAYTFRVSPQPSYAEGVSAPVLGKKSFKWTSSDSKLATVKANADGTADITIKAKAHGVCTISAQTTDLAKITSTFQLKVMDRSPRLGASTVTLNPMLDAGAELVLLASYGNEILPDGIALADAQLEAQYDPQQGILTIRAAEALNRKTIKTVLTVPCQDGRSYTYNLTVTVKAKAPSITAKQASKLDLFFTDSKATVNVTAKGAVVTDVALKDTDDFVLDYDGETAVVSLSDAYLAAPAAKPDTKATLLVWLDGYAQPVSKAITIGTTTTKLSLTTDPASSILNTALSQDRSICFYVRNKKTKEPLILTQDDLSAVEGIFVESYDVTEDGRIRLVLKDNTGGAALVTIQADNWVRGIQLKHTVSTSDTLPTVKLAAATLKLSSIFTQQTASTSVNVSHGNLSISGFGSDNAFVPTAKAGTAAHTEASKIHVYYDGEQVVAQIRDPENAPKNGNYTYTAVPMLEGTELKAVTVKVNVSSKAPKVKFASTLKLNTQLSGSEVATAPVSVNNSTGYALTVVDFLGMDAHSANVDLSFDAVSGQFQAKLLSGTAKNYSYSLIPVVRDENGFDVQLPSPVKLTIQAKQSKVSISHSASGKLDLLNPDSSILYTVKKITNAAGRITGISLVDVSGEETDLFLTEFNEEAQTFTLKLDPQNTYSTKETYKVKLRYSLCGISVDSKVLSIKVAQSKLKLTAENCQYFQSQTAPMQVTISVKTPVGARILAAEVNTEKTAEALLQALGTTEPQVFQFPEGVTEARMAIPVVSAGYLTAGKKYSLVLNVTAAGINAPTEVKVSVTVNR